MENRDMGMRLRCSVLRALLKEVDKRMIAVTVGIRGKTICLRSYVEGPVRPDDLERIQRISTEVISDFCDDYLIEEECQSGEYDNLEALDFWAFYRARD